jgi:flagellin
MQGVTSLHTSVSSVSAIQLLRAIDADLQQAYRQISTGYRNDAASDNAAYWSIATTVRSDRKAISAIGDALNVSTAVADVAYSALEQTLKALDEFRVKVVTAQEPGVDRFKVQSELEQLKDHIASIYQSSSFTGQNWLLANERSNLRDLHGLPLELPFSYSRSGEGDVSLDHKRLDLSEIVLVNFGGGGALQKDPFTADELVGSVTEAVSNRSDLGIEVFAMTDAVILEGSEEIRFDIAIDETIARSVVISKSTIDLALGTSSGVIPDSDSYLRVLNRAFLDAGISPNVVAVHVALAGIPSETAIGIETRETSGGNPSSVFVNNVSDGSGNNAGGLASAPLYQYAGGFARGTLTFVEPIRLGDGTTFTFDVAISNDIPQTKTVTQELLASALGSMDATISSAADLATVLQAAMPGLGVTISSNSTQVVFEIDPLVHPERGWRSSIYLSSLQLQKTTITGGVDFDLVDVDITTSGVDIDNYIQGLDIMLTKVTSAAAIVGAASKSIKTQTMIVEETLRALDQGVGRLVDADLDEISARLVALQTKSQIAHAGLNLSNNETFALALLV